jgi:hypothetical protein
MKADEYVRGSSKEKAKKVGGIDSGKARDVEDAPCASECITGRDVAIGKNESGEQIKEVDRDVSRPNDVLDRPSPCRKWNMSEMVEHNSACSKKAQSCERL